MTAALAFPELKVCKGLELLEQLTNLAQSIATKLHEQCEAKQITYAPVEIH